MMAADVANRSSTTQASIEAESPNLPPLGHTNPRGLFATNLFSNLFSSSPSISTTDPMNPKLSKIQSVIPPRFSHRPISPALQDDPAFSQDPMSHPLFISPTASLSSWSLPAGHPSINTRTSPPPYSSLNSPDDYKLVQPPNTPMSPDGSSNTIPTSSSENYFSSSSASTSNSSNESSESTPPSSAHDSQSALPLPTPTGMTSGQISPPVVTPPPEKEKKKKLSFFSRKSTQSQDTSPPPADISSSKASSTPTLSSDSRPSVTRNISAPELSAGPSFQDGKPPPPPRPASTPLQPSLKLAKDPSLKANPSLTRPARRPRRVLDRIDELDETNPFVAVHHGGPYEAILKVARGVEVPTPTEGPPYNVGSLYQQPKPHQDNDGSHTPQKERGSKPSQRDQKQNAPPNNPLNFGMSLNLVPGQILPRNLVPGYGSGSPNGYAPGNSQYYYQNQNEPPQAQAQSQSRSSRPSPSPHSQSQSQSQPESYSPAQTPSAANTHHPHLLQRPRPPHQRHTDNPVYINTQLTPTPSPQPQPPQANQNFLGDIAQPSRSHFRQAAEQSQSQPQPQPQVSRSHFRELSEQPRPTPTQQSQLQQQQLGEQIPRPPSQQSQRSFDPYAAFAQSQEHSQNQYVQTPQHSRHLSLPATNHQGLPANNNHTPRQHDEPLQYGLRDADMDALAYGGLGEVQPRQRDRRSMPVQPLQQQQSMPIQIQQSAPVQQQNPPLQHQNVPKQHPIRQSILIQEQQGILVPQQAAPHHHQLRQSMQQVPVLPPRFQTAGSRTPHPYVNAPPIPLQNQAGRGHPRDWNWEQQQQASGSGYYNTNTAGHSRYTSYSDPGHVQQRPNHRSYASYSDPGHVQSQQGQGQGQGRDPRYTDVNVSVYPSFSDPGHAPLPQQQQQQWQETRDPRIMGQRQQSYSVPRPEPQSQLQPIPDPRLIQQSQAQPDPRTTHLQQDLGQYNQTRADPVVVDGYTGQQQQQAPSSRSRPERERRSIAPSIMSGATSARTGNSSKPPPLNPYLPKRLVMPTPLQPSSLAVAIAPNQFQALGGVHHHQTQPQAAQPQPPRFMHQAELHQQQQSPFVDPYANNANVNTNGNMNTRAQEIPMAAENHGRKVLRKRSSMNAPPIITPFDVYAVPSPPPQPTRRNGVNPSAPLNFSPPPVVPDSYVHPHTVTFAEQGKVEKDKGGKGGKEKMKVPKRVLSKRRNDL